MTTAAETENALRKRNRAVLESFLAAVSAGDLGAIRSVCTDDVVVEIPYSDPPAHFESFADFRAFLEPSLAMVDFTLLLGETHECADPTKLIAEFTSDGKVLPTGKPYRNVYIGVYRFRDGRICAAREFFNPMIAAEALSPD